MKWGGQLWQFNGSLPAWVWSSEYTEEAVAAAVSDEYYFTLIP